MSFFNTDQLYHSEALRSNNRFMNENIKIMEGFGEMSSSKNSSQTSDTTTYSNGFEKNIDRYTNEYPTFIAETRNAVKLKNKNIKDNSILFKNGVNNMYDITYEKEGCYKSAGAAGLELQSDMNDATGQTCSTRAFDLGYTGFAIGKGSGGQNICYLSKDISQAKVGGIATKPMTSFSFKKSRTANIGGLLGNGQIGSYDSTKITDNDLVTDLPWIEGCELTGAAITINENSVTATWGGKCIDTSKEFFLQSFNSNKCIFNNKDGRFGTFPCLNYTDQHWTLHAVPGQKNTYMFKGVDSYYSLYSDANGNFSTAVSDINNPSQQWELIPISGQPDTYQLKSKQTGGCIISNADGRFNMASCYAPYNDQWWKIIPVAALPSM